MALIISLAVVLVIALHFPYDVDAPLTPEQIAAAQKYYIEAYQQPVIEPVVTSDFETEYLRAAQSAAESMRIVERVSAFVKEFNLADRPVLEIGSGRGYLQDVANNYTGLDLSPNVARFYRKTFVLGSATAMPFPDNSFDGIWSIWVFEHVPNPEQAFREARRVMRDKGVLYLLPEWNAKAWAADGYEVRPYSDFNLIGKVVKASIRTRSRPLFKAITRWPNRWLRYLAAQFGPTRLHYHRLTPNYEKYWVPDSDAVNSLDWYEAKLWFLSRGDQCINCDKAGDNRPLIIRVNKGTQAGP